MTVDRRLAAPTVGFGPGAPSARWVSALFGLNLRLLLTSGLNRFAAFHMAELRFARRFQLGFRLFQPGFLLTKVGFGVFLATGRLPVPSAVAGQS